MVSSMCVSQRTLVPEVCVSPCQLSQESVLNKNSRVCHVLLHCSCSGLRSALIWLNIFNWFMFMGKSGVQCILKRFNRGRKVPEWIPHLISCRVPIGTYNVDFPERLSSRRSAFSPEHYSDGSTKSEFKKKPHLEGQFRLNADVMKLSDCAEINSNSLAAVRS